MSRKNKRGYVMPEESYFDELRKLVERVEAEAKKLEERTARAEERELDMQREAMDNLARALRAEEELDRLKTEASSRQVRQALMDLVFEMRKDARPENSMIYKPDPKYLAGREHAYSNAASRVERVVFDMFPFTTYDGLVETAPCDGKCVKADGTGCPHEDGNGCAEAQDDT